MRYGVISAFAAGVLSIFLIFALFSSIILYESDFEVVCGVRVTAPDTSCSMNSSASEVPFANTRFASVSGADVCEENKLLNIPFISVADLSNVINNSGAACFSVLSDMRAGYLVRLLI